MDNKTKGLDADEISLLSHRLDVLASLLRSQGENLPSLYFNSRSADWQDEITALVADELDRLSLFLHNGGCNS